MRNPLSGICPLSSFVLLIAMAMLMGGCSPQQIVKEWQQTGELKEQAESGDAENQYRLGMMYTNGRGVIRSDTSAVHWFKKAADAGHEDAQFMLGAAYSSGRGVEQDHILATNWYLKAAGAGQERAQYQLADAYINGRGVERDIYWGARWYGMAADRGHDGAQFYLGALYSKGLGLPQSWFQSALWLKRAELSGHPQASDGLKTVRSKIPKARFEDAMIKASQWKPTAGPAGYDNRPTLIYLQHALNHLGHPAGFPDGILGPKTERAIAAYRENRGQQGEVSLAQIVHQLRKETPGLK